ncbi:sialate O-acetylesterase [Flavivirga spongiicola]|uniref:Sialate O-acetylesterase n=1 Tax=Flavivirga spongiicola TaxID=421621 RepID=A0ABU7XUZ6_9FLAO|nr:sialate O-acetylesterase [Flavivirga sp. MEBiC05379]MDO5979589.1 sialate O-acetylesterase [Flavivirga sp. MEBiC05379]
MNFVVNSTTKPLRKIVLAYVFFLCCLNAQAKIWLPSVLSDNMVLQQNSEATIWGWTTRANEKISVTGSWDNIKITVEAYQGTWSLKLPTPKAGGPFTVTIEGHEKIILTNVLIGEVWICSGQSNMEWTPLHGLDNAEKEIANATYSNIRFFSVPKHISKYPQDDSFGEWVESAPETMKNFSSVGYFFGRRLHKDLNVPVGLINSSWGGTNVEVWIPEEVIQQKKELVKSIDRIPENVWRPRNEALAYNAMIHPLINFDVAGAIWYQGESNRVNAEYYHQAFSMMINSWRKDWKKEFPFYFVEIAPYNYNSETNLEAAYVREAQLKTMQTVENTGMAVTNDIGNLKDIHPTNKQEVGRRLALWALAKTYGVKDIAYSGPIYKSLKIEKSKAIVTFDFTGKGLEVKGKEVKEFFIAGADKKFYPAKVKVYGNRVELKSKKVKKPVAVRFAFTETALPNLYNSHGLPAAAFRTDDWGVKKK